jgi:lysine-N-methylase
MNDKSVNTLIPEYMKQFTCIGAACEDTCCSGWRVDIDEETYKKYKKVKHYEMKDSLNKNIIRNRSNPTKSNVAKMKMERLKCSFLSDEGWCNIQLKLGEDYLCNTCTVYPRSVNNVNGVIERSLTVSCPEAARLILLNKNGISFEQGEEDVPSRDLTNRTIHSNSEDITSWKDLFNEYRYISILILQERKYTLEERLLILGLLYNELEECVVSNNINDIPNILGKYLECLDTNVFDGAFDNIPKRLDIQLRLCRELVLLRLSQGVSSSRYLECSRDMMTGLKIEENFTDSALGDIYEDAHNKYYMPFIKEHEYMLENYLVNYVFKDCMPLDSNSPFESYAQLIVHYSLIKLHLVGMANHNEGLTSEMVIKLIQSISKTFEHNKQFLYKIMKLIKDNNFMNLTYMSILIKH